MASELVAVDENQQSKSISLFNTDSPTLIIQEATEIANQLSDIITEKRLFKPISGKNHVYVEGWTTLGALLGVFPDPVYSKRLDRENEIAYEAKVIVRTLSGVKISTGEGFCSNKETNWKFSDEYAIKSMATTRATSKALRIPLGWIMTLAGYSATPAEEMTFVENSTLKETSNSSTSNHPPAPNSPPPVVDGVSEDEQDKILNEIETPPEVPNESEPKDVQDAELSKTYEPELFKDTNKGELVIELLKDEKKPLTRKNINARAVKLMPERLTMDDVKEITSVMDKADKA